MDIEIIESLFSNCFDNGCVPNKENKEDSWNDLSFFINTRCEMPLVRIFRGDTVSMQKFITTCYCESLLPVQVFGPLLREFVLRNAGGALYRYNLSLLFEMLHYAGIENMILKDEHEFFKTLPDKITIYRGGNFSDMRDILFYG